MNVLPTDAADSRAVIQDLAHEIPISRAERVVAIVLRSRVPGREVSKRRTQASTERLALEACLQSCHTPLPLAVLNVRLASSRVPIHELP